MKHNALSVALDGVLTNDDEQYADFSTIENSVTLPALNKLIEKLRMQKVMIMKVLSNADAPIALAEFISKTLDDLCKMKRCSYHKFNYIAHLMNNVMELFKSQEPGIFESLINLLYSMNYNSVDFIAYYQEKIKQEMNALSEGQEQICRLHLYLSQFKKAPYRKKKIQFDPNRRSTAQLMYAFVEGEICQRERQAEQAGVIPTGYKIQSLLNVDCLAYLFRLMVEGKIIEAGVKTELTRFLANIFVTPGTAANGISPDNFYRKWRDPIYTNAMMTKAALNRMIKIIDSQF
ncbi:hypothetical protein ACXZ1K_16060 [Pedobacter sp. PWIIR3]